MCSKIFCASLFACAVFGLVGHLLHQFDGSRRFAERYYPAEPPVKTLVLENGDIVDCVDFYSQPAMRHSHVRKLYEYEMQSRTRLQTPRKTITEIESHGSLSDSIRGFGLKEGSCPPGSVPFLKATKSGPLNHSAVEKFVSSRARFFRLRSNSTKLSDSNNNSNDDDNNNGHKNHPIQHEHAIVEALRGSYGGANGSFNHWSPFTEHGTGGSLTQLQLTKKYQDGNVATLETGWMVNAALYGDQNARFFCFTTPDDYETWLYNADRRISGKNNLAFNQVSRTVFPGTIISTSASDGQQKEIQLEIKKDLQTGNWKLSFNGEIVGFWLKTNYNSDFNVVEEIRWGGEVLNGNCGRKHRSTQMGNGHFGSEGIGSGAYISYMGVYDHNLIFSDAPYPLELYTTNSTCYDIKDWGKTSMGRMITYGGPGYNGFLCV